MSDNWMSPREYFDRYVRAAVEEYFRDGLDHHKASAVLHLSNFSERYFKYHKRQGHDDLVWNVANFEDFRKILAARHAEYGLLWGAANAVDHQIPDEGRSFSGLVQGATEIFDSGDRKLDDRINRAIRRMYEFWQNRLGDHLILQD